jgi:hypothetical protein
MLRRLAFVALVAAPSSVMAASITVGGTSVNLPSPTGFCELTQSNASDKRMITTIDGLLSKSGNKLLSMTADCQQLTAWRTSKRPLLDDFAQYQTTLSQLEASSGSPEPITTTCATLRAEGETLLSNMMPEIKSRIESTVSKVKVNETAFVGVLDEEPTACYAALIQKFHTAANTDKTQVTVFATTIIKDKLIFVYRMGVSM